MVRCMIFDAIDPSLSPHFAELFLPFQISYRSQISHFQYKNEGYNQKVETKHRAKLG